ncbi:hypothetical protein BKK79_00855 [Cupriavidus sp. USMAA2-4]|uniref:hypothetical protein n=1 Tax=Cupriavidus sp. USMAA2-4 TaxID=876364 RepID=UPI0008A6FEAD|nr:hypothetical protein [Cupriavidus sp. USMAA2-4]AOY90536.1 hypothetical protein BKK79_00855 [Cupriavidus sp. USMAA2-4]
MDELRYRYFVTLLLVLGLVAVVCWAFAHWTPKDSSEVATWVQAIGAIIGIGIAIAVPAWQHRMAERRREGERREEKWRVLRLVALLAERAKSRTEDIGTTRSREGFVETPTMRASQRADLEEILSALDQVPLTSIATMEALQYFIKLKKLVAKAIGEVDRIPYPTADATCGEVYGHVWVSLYNQIKEAAQVLSWQAKQYRSDEREPAVSFPQDDF